MHLLKMNNKRRRRRRWRT